MKVLHIFNEITFSGAEIMYAQAAPLFQREGFEILAFSTGPQKGDFTPDFKKKGITVIHQPINFKILSLKWFKYYFNLYHFLKKEKIKVLHIHRSDIIFAAFIAFLAKTRCIKTQHSTFRNRWFTLPYAVAWRFVLRNFFHVIFQTIGESVYLNELNYYKNPSIKVNNWFNENQFYAPSTKEKINFRNQLGIARNVFVIISVGSCSECKNHHDIIKALSLVKDKMKVIYLHLGKGSTEQEEKQLAISLCVSDSIRFLGKRNNVRDYLIAADLFVMTSQYEGLGNSALEAMACRTPCILYNSVGLRDLIKDNNNGLLIERSHQLLADKILEIQKNQDLAYSRANNAFEFVDREFSMSVGVKKIIDLYRG